MEIKLSKSPLCCLCSALQLYPISTFFSPTLAPFQLLHHSLLCNLWQSQTWGLQTVNFLPLCLVVGWVCPSVQLTGAIFWMVTLVLIVCNFVQTRSFNSTKPLQVLPLSSIGNNIWLVLLTYLRFFVFESVWRKALEWPNFSVLQCWLKTLCFVRKSSLNVDNQRHDKN